MKNRENQKTRHLLPLAGYSLISLIVTWPLVTHLRGWVPGFGDWGQNLWALWWTRRALLAEGRQPFFTDYLFYPDGVTLLFHPLDLSDGLLALPLYGLLGGDASYNLMILISFVLGGYGAYLLALYLTHHRAASFIAGLIFTLSPYHFLRVDLGHLNLSTLQWIPFYILFLLKFVERGDRRSGAVAIFFLVFTALNSWYYVIYCGLFSLAVIFWPEREQLSAVSGQTAAAPVHSSPVGRRSLPAIRVATVLVGAFVLLLPLLLPMFRLLGSTALIGAHDPLRHSVDLLSFFVPGPPSTWAGWFEATWTSYAAQNREPGASAYLGYSVLILSGIGLFNRRWRRQVIWWLVVALGFALLALGPQLQIGGRIYDFSLPYQWLATLVPVFSITGIPGRFVVMTSLGLAVLAAYGVVRLSKVSYQLSAISGQQRVVNSRSSLFILHSLFFILILLEFLAVPLRLTSTEVNPFYQALATDRESYAVVDIKWDANFLMHAQTVHQKPIIGGWLARLPAEQAAYLDEPSLDKAFVRLLLGGEGAALTDPAAVPMAMQAALAEREVRYIIDHNNAAGPWLREVLGWPVVYEDDAVVVYRVAE